MLITFRSILVGALLIATHLGIPGGAIAEFSSAMSPIQPRATPGASEEPGNWRPDSAIGLAGDLDPASTPVKQPALSDGSGGLPDPGMPRTPTYAVAAIPPTEPSVPPAVAVASSTVPKYEVEENHHVQHFVDRFQTGYRRAVVEKWLTRSGQYLPMILDVFRQKGLPDELVFTAMIESGFNPVAVSRAGAKGMWQFMAGTARRYGLRVDQWIDERLDPEKSTIAAAAYLRDLYAMFGSWTLAQAAYNAGEVKVSRAIRATGSSDFWTLAKTNHLRAETRNFVPAIHAATLIAQDPGRYGFEFTATGPLAVETVSVPASTDLRRLAPRTGIALDALRTLNPVLVRSITPPGDAWQLKVPAGTRADVMTALAPPAKPTLPAKTARGGTLRPAASRGDVHVVQPRDTVRSIAKRYGVSVSDVLRWNRLEEQGRIRPGDRLRVADVRPSVADGQGGFR